MSCDSWVTKCPESKLPPRLRVIDGKLVKLSGTGGTVGTVYTPYNIYGLKHLTLTELDILVH